MAKDLMGMAYDEAERSGKLGGFKHHARKIDVFQRTEKGWRYLWSTNAYANCKEAAKAAARELDCDKGEVKAVFDGSR